VGSVDTKQQQLAKTAKTKTWARRNLALLISSGCWLVEWLLYLLLWEAWAVIDSLKQSGD
jgi:hypothetical protein